MYALLTFIAATILFITGLLKPLHASLLFSCMPHALACYGYWCGALCIGISLLWYMHFLKTHALSSLMVRTLLAGAVVIPLTLHVALTYYPPLMLLFFGLVESCCFMFLSMFWSYCHGTHATAHDYAWFGWYLVAGQVGYTLGLLTARALPIPYLLVAISSVLCSLLALLALRLPLFSPASPPLFSLRFHHFTNPTLHAVIWPLLLYQGVHTWMEMHLYKNLTYVTPTTSTHISYTTSLTLIISLVCTLLTPIASRRISRATPRPYLLFVLPCVGACVMPLFSLVPIVYQITLFALLRCAYFCWFSPYREMSCTQLSPIEKQTLRPIGSAVSKYLAKGTGALSSPPILALLCGLGLIFWYRADKSPTPQYEKDV